MLGEADSSIPLSNEQVEQVRIASATAQNAQAQRPPAAGHFALPRTPSPSPSASGCMGMDPSSRRRARAESNTRATSPKMTRGTQGKMTPPEAAPIHSYSAEGIPLDVHDNRVYPAVHSYSAEGLHKKGMAMQLSLSKSLQHFQKSLNGLL